MWNLGSKRMGRIEDAVVQYLPPCQIRCPINEDIQRTNVLISFLPKDPEQAQGGIIQIGDYIYQKNPFFTVCGYICGLCERDCNYKTKGGAIKRRLLKRFISDTYTPYLPEKKSLDLPKEKEKVAVVGGGPGGLMCAYELRKRGYGVTVFDAGEKLGGAARYIPEYRLPEEVLDAVVDTLVKVADIDVQLGTKIGEKGLTLQQLREKGYSAFFVATGTPFERSLSFGTQLVEGLDLDGVMSGLSLLGEVNKGHIPADHFKDKKVIVIGGGNVAFDVARTARRLGGEVTLVALEELDKKSKDAIPADEEEIEGAWEEGITIVPSRGISQIVKDDGKLKLECPQCISVFEGPTFSPKFECSDLVTLEADVVLPTIGQTTDRHFLHSSGLLDRDGKLVVDPVTLQNLVAPDVFIGGDVRKIGFLAEAMGEGVEAADSIDKYLSGTDPLMGKRREYQPDPTPTRSSYKYAPESKWLPSEERLNFDVFEEGFSLEEAIEEGRRCLTCGPCISCKACLAVGIREDLPVVEVNEDLCSGCGMCVYSCNYEAAKLKLTEDGKLVSYTNKLECKTCGMCVAVCPSNARTFSRVRRTTGSRTDQRVKEVYSSL